MERSTGEIPEYVGANKSKIARGYTKSNRESHNDEVSERLSTMDRLKYHKEEANYHGRIANGHLRAIEEIEARERMDILQAIVSIKVVTQVAITTKVISVSRFTEELVPYMKMGWKIQASMF